MSNPKVEEVTWYQFTVTKDMAYAIYRLIGQTSIDDRVEKFSIPIEDSRRLSKLYGRLSEIVDE